MGKIKMLLTASLLVVTTMVFAYTAPPPGGKFCKNNPTTNTGTCIYFSSGGVAECNTVVTATKDCYGTGVD
jgi:hypothetical protein